MSERGLVERFRAPAVTVGVAVAIGASACGGGASSRETRQPSATQEGTQSKGTAPGKENCAVKPWDGKGDRKTWEPKESGYVLRGWAKLPGGEWVPRPVVQVARSNESGKPPATVIDKIGYTTPDQVAANGTFKPAHWIGASSVTLALSPDALNYGTVAKARAADGCNDTQHGDNPYIQAVTLEGALLNTSSTPNQPTDRYPTFAPTTVGAKVADGNEARENGGFGYVQSEAPANETDLDRPPAGWVKEG